MNPVQKCWLIYSRRTSKVRCRRGKPLLGVGRPTTGRLRVKIPGNIEKPMFHHFLPDGAITIRNIFVRRCFIPLNSLNGQIEMLSFTTVPYDYYGSTNYIDVVSGRLDRGMDSGLRKESPDGTIYFIDYFSNNAMVELYRETNRKGTCLNIRKA